MYRMSRYIGSLLFLFLLLQVFSVSCFSAEGKFSLSFNDSISGILNELKIHKLILKSKINIRYYLLLRVVPKFRSYQKNGIIFGSL